MNIVLLVPLRSEKKKSHQVTGLHESYPHPLLRHKVHLFPHGAIRPKTYNNWDNCLLTSWGDIEIVFVPNSMILTCRRYDEFISRVQWPRVLPSSLAIFELIRVTASGTVRNFQRPHELNEPYWFLTCIYERAGEREQRSAGERVDRKEGDGNLAYHPYTYHDLPPSPPMRPPTAHK